MYVRFKLSNNCVHMSLKENYGFKNPTFVTCVNELIESTHISKIEGNPNANFGIKNNSIFNHRQKKKL